MSDSSVSRRPERAPLKPFHEGWRRFALLGVFALAALGVLATLGAIYLLPLLIPLMRGA